MFPLGRSGLANLICEELEKNKIQATQVQGLSVDCQYIGWHVDHILKEKLNLGRTFMASWDALHRYMHFSFRQFLRLKLKFSGRGS